MDSSTPAAEQLSLFDAVVATYAERERASNESLYQEQWRACAVGIIDSRTGAIHVPRQRAAADLPRGFTMSPHPQWAVYSDGGCAPHNPGPCAWGAVIEPPDGESIERNGFLGHGTNQIAELTGAIEGLKATPVGASVLLVSDSQYVIKGLTEWRHGWERRGWRNSQGDPVANGHLWRALFALADQRRVQARWVKGHAGHPQNERADKLASQALAAARLNRHEVDSDGCGDATAARA